MIPVLPILIFAIGNESRGDDALGPLLARRIDSMGFEGVEVIEEFQLQIENTLDMQGRDLLLFVDAETRLSSPYHFRRITAKPFDSHTSHAIAPDALLGIYEQINTQKAPAAYVLGINGNDFELGSDLSESASKHLESANLFVQKLLANPTDHVWDRMKG